MQDCAPGAAGAADLTAPLARKRRRPASSSPRMTLRVRILLSQAEAVLHFGPGLDRARHRHLVHDGRLDRPCARLPLRHFRTADRRPRLFLFAVLPLVLPVLRHLGRHLRRLLVPLFAASVAVVVDPRLGLHPLHHLLRRAGLGRDQQLAPAVLRRFPAGAVGQRQGHGLGSLFADDHFRRDRDGVDVRLRHHALLRQPLRLPLAHGDEQLLHVALAARALHRRRLAARPGGHHALRQHRRGTGRFDRLLDHDAGRLPAGAVATVEIRHRTAAGRPYPGAAVHGADLLGRVRHDSARRRRHQAAGARIQEPARRSGLPQGTGLWRRQRGPRPAADGRAALLERPAQLFPALFPLHVLQRRPRALPAGRQHLRQPDPHPDHRRRQDHAWASGSRSSPPSARCRAPSSSSSIPGPRSSSCCRSTSACAPSRRSSRGANCRATIASILEGKGEYAVPTLEPEPGRAGRKPVHDFER